MLSCLDCLRVKILVVSRNTLCLRHESLFLIEGHSLLCNPATVTREILLEDIVYILNTMNLYYTYFCDFEILNFHRSCCISTKICILVGCSWIFWNIKLNRILPITKVANRIIVAPSGSVERDGSKWGHGLKVPRRDQGHWAPGQGQQGQGRRCQVSTIYSVVRFCCRPAIRWQLD